MNNLNLISKTEEFSETSNSKKPISPRKKSSTQEDIQAVRIYKKTTHKIEALIEESKKLGPSRIQARDLIRLAITKIETADLEKLREETATTEDRFQEKLKEFQKNKPNATREDFMEHLLNKSVHSL